MEDGLPGFGTAAVEQVDAVGTEFGEHDSGDPLGSQNCGGQVVGGDLDKVGAVPLGDYQ